MSLLSKAKNPMYKILLGVVLGFFSIGAVSLPAFAGVDDFRFKSLDVDYHLSLDDEGRSLLRVKEVFVAEFPEFNQNRGIVRAIPISYQKHPLSLQLGEIYRNGQIAPIAKHSTENGFRRLEIRGDNYLHGENTYEINYTMRDVILDPDNTNIQEFYWDVNGTGWGQPFDSVTARLTLAEDLRDKLTGAVACYTGFSGSTSQDCTINLSGDDLVASTTNKLLARQNLTIAVGFKSGTFMPYQMSQSQKILLRVIKKYLAVVAIALAVLIGKRISLGGGAKNKTAVVTQFLPPEEVDVVESATLLGLTHKSATATLVDLAVRRKIKIKEAESRGLFGASVKDYKIVISSDENLTSNEQAILSSYIQDGIRVGNSREIKHNMTDYTIPTKINQAIIIAYTK